MEMSSEKVQCFSDVDLVNANLKQENSKHASLDKDVAVENVIRQLRQKRNIEVKKVSDVDSKMKRISSVLGKNKSSGSAGRSKSLTVKISSKQIKEQDIKKKTATVLQKSKNFIEIEDDEIEDYLEIDQNVVKDLEALIPEEEIESISNSLIEPAVGFGSEASTSVAKLDHKNMAITEKITTKSNVNVSKEDKIRESHSGRVDNNPVTKRNEKLTITAFPTTVDQNEPENNNDSKSEIPTNVRKLPSDLMVVPIEKKVDSVTLNSKRPKNNTTDKKLSGKRQQSQIDNKKLKQGSENCKKITDFFTTESIKCDAKQETEINELNLDNNLQDVTKASIPNSSDKIYSDKKKPELKVRALRSRSKISEEIKSMNTDSPVAEIVKEQSSTTKISIQKNSQNSNESHINIFESDLSKKLQDAVENQDIELHERDIHEINLKKETGKTSNFEEPNAELEITDFNCENHLKEGYKKLNKQMLNEESPETEIKSQYGKRSTKTRISSKLKVNDEASSHIPNLCNEVKVFEHGDRDQPSRKKKCYRREENDSNNQLKPNKPIRHSSGTENGNNEMINESEIKTKNSISLRSGKTTLNVKEEEKSSLMATATSDCKKNGNSSSGIKKPKNTISFENSQTVLNIQDEATSFIPNPKGGGEKMSDDGDEKTKNTISLINEKTAPIINNQPNIPINDNERGESERNKINANADAKTNKYNCKGESCEKDSNEYINYEHRGENENKKRKRNLRKAYQVQEFIQQNISKGNATSNAVQKNVSSKLKIYDFDEKSNDGIEMLQKPLKSRKLKVRAQKSKVKKMAVPPTEKQSRYDHDISNISDEEMNINNDEVNNSLGNIEEMENFEIESAVDKVGEMKPADPSDPFLELKPRNIQGNQKISLNWGPVYGPYKRVDRCNVCLMTFKNYNRLKAHKKIHLVENPYKCNQCHHSFGDVEKLAAHLQIHRGKMPFSCRKCDATFWTEAQLEKHLPIHVLKKPPPPSKPPRKVFKCEECTKEFKKMSDLERHIRVHTGEKPSVCNICNKRFQQPYNLSKHLHTHTQEKNFECVICQKKFGRNDVLNRHVLTHSIVKPFKCSLCLRTFIRNSQLKIHLTKHHNLEEDPGNEMNDLVDSISFDSANTHDEC